MEHKIIKTGNYLLVVSDEEIKDGDWYLCWETIDNTPSNYETIKATDKEPLHWYSSAENYKKIICHLPLDYSPILEGLDLLPQIEVEFEKLADEFYPLNDYLYSNSSLVRKGVKYGYNKAKSKFKYTEEDMRKCWDACLNFNKPAGLDSGINFKDFIQSISQPKLPIAFKQGNIVDGKTYISITRRHDGFTVWIGEYIY